MALWEKIGEWLNENLFRHIEAIWKEISEVKTWIQDKIAHALIDATDYIVARSAQANIEWIEQFGKIYGLQTEDIDRLKKMAVSGEFGLAAVLGIVAGATIIPGISKAAEPALNIIQQDAYEKMPTNIADINTLTTALYRQYIDKKTYSEYMKKLGFNEEQQKLIIDSYKYYPSAEDFIRFAVRDVFHPKVVEKYGYDKDFPTEILKYIEKAGLDAQTLKWYWRAHWQLPSITLGFEMLRRGAITEEDLHELLLINDIAPYWIDKILQIRYLPLDRIDLRRLYKAGIIKKQDVYNGYLKLGYDKADAEKLTNFAIMDNLAKQRELTMSQILTAYKDKIIQKTDAINDLVKLGYEKEDAELLIAIADYQAKQKFQREEIMTLKWEYAYGIKTKEDIENEFNRMNMSEDRKALLIREFDLFKRRHHARSKGGKKK